MKLSVNPAFRGGVLAPPWNKALKTKLRYITVCYGTWFEVILSRLTESATYQVGGQTSLKQEAPAFRKQEADN